MIFAGGYFSVSGTTAAGPSISLAVCAIAVNANRASTAPISRREILVSSTGFIIFLFLNFSCRIRSHIPDVVIGGITSVFRLCPSL
ncbi:MAG: hypothetical protein QOJ42_2497, partial [Acidobacteriaceae bacterium]|nr:hypothetical protein [Acidobacteriaceae bacterium]